MYQSKEKYPRISVNVIMTYLKTLCTKTGVGYNSNPIN